MALDAVTGKAIWKNDTSGALAEDVNCGISLQGELQLRGDELQFLGGGAYQVARYDRKTGASLNQPRHEVTSQFQTAFYPYFPMYAKYSSLNHTLPDRKTLAYLSSYDGSHPTRLGVLAPPAPITDQPRPKTPPRRAHVPKRDGPAKPPPRQPIWQTDQPRLYTAFVVTPSVLLAGGPADQEGDRSQLSAIAMEDGSVLWQRSLPALPVKAGIALDSQQRIVVTLENGQLLCFGPASGSQDNE